MGFFKWFGPADPEQEQARKALAEKIANNRAAELVRQEGDIARLERGGIPIEAQTRLAELGQRADTDAHIFTSNLAPDELALLRRNGYRPRGLITGSAVWHVGQAFASFNDCEVLELSRAYENATALAVSRMQIELNLLKAHGVVGVTLNMVRHEWGEKIVEVQVMGTAVDGPGPAPAKPWMCDLSVQEWWALRRAGYEPVALVWGYCAWFLFTSAFDELIHQSWNNVEFEHYSTGLSVARTIAMRNLTQLARADGATGIVGVTIERKLKEIRLSGPDMGEIQNRAYEREHHNLTITMIGTAIRASAHLPSAVKPTVTMLSLRDGRLRPITLLKEDVQLYD